ncbi:AMP-binding protein [Pseudidiomarina andamanensis]|uniref:Long-chain acyl-CoA synthetase n=1 Tax=Pseudidiomarina andamanensis TaxID=1940690 RepID=A0AA92ETN9_9GAMM|nr:AMP-binding protein [Pseudidiomarina andamanensis]MDS0218616.1 AMP-binding protein [Pseudidiomarina andamanensis]QGT95481.1 long-chain acyl-CoA synthetase [Pseudidiomarina andamanensis]
MLENFKQRLADYAQTRSSQNALADETISITYAQLWERVQQLMAVIQQTPYQRIALDMENSVNWVVYDLAIFFSERVCIPIPPFFTAQQRMNMLRDSGAEVVILANGKMQPLSHDRPPNLPHNLPYGTAKITYTSGSTGAPKGVCLSADNMLKTVAALAERVGNVDTQRHLVLMPLAVLLENVAGVYLSLWLGHEVILASSENLGLTGSSSLDLYVFNSALKHHNAQSLILTPGLLAAVVHGVMTAQLDPTSFKLLAVGGARLSEPTERQAYALGLPLLQGYGLSELGSVVSFNQPNKPALGTVGKPLSHAHVEIKDNEVWVSGNCMLGYLNQPQTWYPKALPTGDLGQFDELGNLQLLGRKKNTIVTAYGRNVDPEWVEGLLTLEPEVLQAAVLGDEELPLTALLVPCANNIDAEMIIERINRDLPDYAKIRQFKLLTTPFTVANEQLTGTGRLRREVIRAHYESMLFANTKSYEVTL